MPALSFIWRRRMSSYHRNVAVNVLEIEASGVREGLIQQLEDGEDVAHAQFVAG